MLKAVIVLLFATSTFGFLHLGDGGKENINFIVDGLLKYLADPLLNSTYANFEIDFVGPLAIGLLNSISGVNTLVRKGDILVWADPVSNTFSAQGSFGLTSMVLHFDHLWLSVSGEPVGDTDISIADNEFYFMLTTTVEDGSCSVSIDNIHVVKANGVTTSSDNPALDGLDITKLTNAMMDFINTKIWFSLKQDKKFQNLRYPCTMSL
jgi:hypothetical protein